MFVLNKDHHSIYDLFKLFLFSYDVDGLNTSIVSKIKVRFMVVLKQFLCPYDFTVGYSFHLILHDTKFWEVKCHDVSKHPSELCD